VKAVVPTVGILIVIAVPPTVTVPVQITTYELPVTAASIRFVHVMLPAVAVGVPSRYFPSSVAPLMMTSSPVAGVNDGDVRVVRFAPPDETKYEAAKATAMSAPYPIFTVLVLVISLRIGS
jgi:hypothetical protein